MKTQFVKYLLAFALSLPLAANLFAQAPAKQPQGFWTVETNVKSRDFAWLRFYDHKNQLLYEEKIDKSLALSPKNKRALDAALQAVLLHEPVKLSMKGGQLQVQSGTGLVAK